MNPNKAPWTSGDAVFFEVEKRDQWFGAEIHNGELSLFLTADVYDLVHRRAVKTKHLRRFARALLALADVADAPCARFFHYTEPLEMFYREATPGADLDFWHGLAHQWSAANETLAELSQDRNPVEIARADLPKAAR